MTDKTPPAHDYEPNPDAPQVGRQAFIRGALGGLAALALGAGVAAGREAAKDAKAQANVWHSAYVFKYGGRWHWHCPGCNAYGPSNPDRGYWFKDQAQSGARAHNSRN